MYNAAEKIHNIAGLILAGGQSRRMGQAKALLDLGGKPLIARVAEQFDRVFAQTLISGSPELASLGLAVVQDKYRGVGPLAGMLAGLEASGTEWVFVLPCDSPFAPEAFIRGMAGMIEDCDAVVPRIGQFYEPLHALYSRRCVAPLERLIISGERQIIKLYDLIRLREAPEQDIRRWDPEGMAFVNLNTPDDLRIAQARYRTNTQE